MRAPIGLRIRNQRQIKGLTQAGLAKQSGISASYLNLIESNRRDVGGTLLHKLAEVLEVELSDLTGEAEQRLLSELHEAFADPVLESLHLGMDDAHQLVARQPQLGRALHQLYRAFLDMRARAYAYSHRLQSDPLFSSLLHQMLTNITAVRSAAEILRDVPDIETPERSRFHQTITVQAEALSAAARSLIAEFDLESERHRRLTPSREVDDLLIGQDNYFPLLEDAARKLRSQLTGGPHLETHHLTDALENQLGVSVKYDGPPQNEPANQSRDFGFSAEQGLLWFRSGVPMATQRFQLARHFAIARESELLQSLVNDESLTSDQARSLAYKALGSYLAGAILFPYDEFLAAAIESRYDLDFLAQKYVASFEQVAHRLVTLRAPGASGIPFGFVRSDAAGFLSKQFPLPGLLMPSAGHACPLWILSAAFRQMNSIVSQTAQSTDGARFLFVAKASAKRISAYTEMPVYSSVMLACNIIHADKTVYGTALNLTDSSLDAKVGPTCRLCVRTDCAHRQEGVAQNLASI
ncbi:MAG: DUF2083 domain-containing protein [Hyphomicrobiaceae bacterium]|nr:DUF2083 domain-containing protein [Hyphomicrobiaceae bacterium]MCC0023630.1 DUF2083 domain-containing protein [Hyphomicrobiaceae bacterium]